MRFVSNGHSLGLGTARPEKFVLALDGQRDMTVRSLPVMFGQIGLTKDDVDFALGYFAPDKFTGRYLEADGVTPEPLTQRVGVFDTVEAQKQEGWTDEERELVEQWMLNHPSLHRDFEQVIPAEKKVDKPWPSYNSTHHFKVADLAAELGLLEEALAYERANKARPGVIEKLEEKLTFTPKAPAEEAGEVVAA